MLRGVLGGLFFNSAFSGKQGLGDDSRRMCTSYLFEPCCLFQRHFIKVEQSEICTVCMRNVSDKGCIAAIQHMI